MKKKKMLVGLPSYKQPDIMCTLSLTRALLRLQSAHNYLQIDLVNTEKVLVHTAREYILKVAYDGKYDYLVWVDDDQVLRSWSLLRLFDCKVHAVSGLYFERRYPYQPIGFYKDDKDIYRRIESQSNRGLIKVDCCGLGCAIVDREIIEVTVNKSLMPNEKYRTEDLVFWQYVNEAGYGVWIATDVVVGHCVNARYVVNEDTVIKLRQRGC
jgi:hypothetical protein